MTRTAIDVVDKNGTFTTPDGVTMHKWSVTLKDGTDGVAFAHTTTPWWLDKTSFVYYEITKVQGTTNHIAFRRSPGFVQTPGLNARPSNWQWALSEAIQVVGPYELDMGPAYFDTLETTARQLADVLNRLQKTR